MKTFTACVCCGGSGSEDLSPSVDVEAQYVTCDYCNGTGYIVVEFEHSFEWPTWYDHDGNAVFVMPYEVEDLDLVMGVCFTCFGYYYEGGCPECKGRW